MMGADASLKSYLGPWGSSALVATYQFLISQKEKGIYASMLMKPCTRTWCFEMMVPEMYFMLWASRFDLYQGLK